MKPALLVIDIQKAWLDETPALKESVERHVGVMNGAIRWFREKGLPLIVIYHEAKDRGVLPGTPGFEFIPAVQIRHDDTRVTKLYPNSFNKTELDSMLRKLGCDAVVIVGLSASGCALATFFGAIDYDYNPLMVKGGVASHSEEHVRLVEDLCEAIGLDEFDRKLR
jgi:nicotinamidase-related amidase